LNKMSKKDISNLIYERLNFSWCRNCRYKKEDSCERSECSLKYNYSSWAISREEADRIAEEIS